MTKKTKLDPNNPFDIDLDVTGDIEMLAIIISNLEKRMEVINAHTSQGIKVIHSQLTFLEMEAVRMQEALGLVQRGLSHVRKRIDVPKNIRLN